MAENLEPFQYFPQQNRKNKLTTNKNTTQNHNQTQQHQMNYSSSSFETPQQEQEQEQQNLSLSLSFQQYAPNELNLKNALLIRNSVPLGPFTGYTSILKRSRFLNPTKQILDEFCGAKFQSNYGFYDFISKSSRVMMKDNCAFGGMEHGCKNSKLGLMLDEVYRKYKLYCQQMQSVVASFESVPGLGNAAPYISFAVKTIGKHFICLKNAILDQIQFLGNNDGPYAAVRGDTSSRLCSIEQGGPQKSGQNLSFVQHPIWRSQRGLPDHAVTQLKKWLFEHFLHPYPTDSEKQMLAQQTGLSRTQVSNWFINARVRVWKPMVEEIHTLETRQAQTQSETARQDTTNITNSLPAEKNVDPTFRQKADAIVQSKRPRNDIMVQSSEEHRNACFNFLAGKNQIGISGNNNSFSLALGLRDNGIRFLQPLAQTESQVDLTARNQNLRVREDY